MKLTGLRIPTGEAIAKLEAKRKLLGLTFEQVAVTIPCGTATLRRALRDGQATDRLLNQWRLALRQLGSETKNAGETNLGAEHAD
jgi:hypothetical protein